jgi:hypothetical protein
MNDLISKSSRKLLRLPKAERDQWVSRLKKSGLTARAFAEKHGLNYATLCRWKNKSKVPGKSPGFVEVQCPGPQVPMEMVIEHRSGLRMTIRSSEQVEWAAALINRLPKVKAC